MSIIMLIIAGIGISFPIWYITLGMLSKGFYSIIEFFCLHSPGIKGWVYDMILRGQHSRGWRFFGLLFSGIYYWFPWAFFTIILLLALNVYTEDKFQNQNNIKAEQGPIIHNEEPNVPNTGISKVYTDPTEAIDTLKTGTQINYNEQLNDSFRLTNNYYKEPVTNDVQAYKNLSRIQKRRLERQRKKEFNKLRDQILNGN